MAKQQYVVHDLKHRSRGDQVEITLKGNAANVRLMNSSNFSNYKAGRKFRCIGGQAKKSPVVLTIPSSGHWYAVVDMFGLRGSVRSSARILPQAMKPLRQSQHSPLSQILRDRPVPVGTHPASEASEVLRTFDVFISHASEDKDEVARPLAEALRARGVDVWYDEVRLRVGDSLREQIARAINSSRFAVVILSESFKSKGWTKHELNGMMIRSIDGQQVILPIWHKLSKQQVINLDPGLADKLALNTAASTIAEMADEIAGIVLGVDEELGLEDEFVG